MLINLQNLPLLWLYKLPVSNKTQTHFPVAMHYVSSGLALHLRRRRRRRRRGRRRRRIRRRRKQNKGMSKKKQNKVTSTL
jgi:hypothetical protein